MIAVVLIRHARVEGAAKQDERAHRRDDGLDPWVSCNLLHGRTALAYLLHKQRTETKHSTYVEQVHQRAAFVPVVAV